MSKADDDKCPGCGETESSADNYYWKCGTMKCKGLSMRGELCYERELRIKDELIKKAFLVIDDMRMIDRYNSRVDFDVEELLAELEKEVKAL